MFEIKYRLSAKEYETLYGDKGYYQMCYNDNSYGEIYAEEIEEVMGTTYLYDWLKDMVQIAIELHSKKYVALSNIESHNQWIEFEKDNNNLYIRIVTADKPNGVGFIVYKLSNRKYEESNGSNSHVSFAEFKKEIITKCNSYILDISEINHKSNNKQKICILSEMLSRLKKLEIYND